MRFQDVMQAMRQDGGSWTAPIPEDWLQGRSAFGGLQVAIALQAMRALVSGDLPLRTLQVTFLAPIPEGTVRVQAQKLRAGKNTQQIEARLMDGDQALCVVIGIFGASRRSSIRVQPQQAAVDGSGIPELGYIKGLMPAFMQHFHMRWLRGGMLFSGATDTRAVVEIGLRETGPTSEAALVTIADGIPPLALALVNQPTPGSSMTWMLEMLSDRYDHLPLQGWRFDAEVLAAADGYTSQTVMIWAPDGSPAMLSRQNMVVFA